MNVGSSSSDRIELDFKEISYLVNKTRTTKQETSGQHILETLKISSIFLMNELINLRMCFQNGSPDVKKYYYYQGHNCKTHPNECVFSLTGKIEGGLPYFQPPPFSLELNVSEEFGSNSTVHEFLKLKYFGFGDMVSTLGAAIIIIPVIAILESVAIAKAFGNI